MHDVSDAIQPNNPHAQRPVTLSALVVGLWQHRELILQMSKREVIGRYKGSVMGLLWSLLNPLFMLAVYTFAFSVVFKARWDTGEDEGKVQFAVVLFAGLIVYMFFSEVLNRASGLIVNNTNYVKKVVFPLEIMPVTTVLAALFHSLISFGVLMGAFLLFNGYLNWTAVFVPVVLLPLVVLALGLSWILSALGVYLRDVGQTVGILTLALPFLAPVFFPISALPAVLRPWLLLNPLTVIIEEIRAVVIWGDLPNFMALGIYLVVAIIVAWIGYAWFQVTRRGFADVL